MQTTSPSKDNAYLLIRYFVAFVIMFYGFAKLNGSQFTILDSELDKPMGEVSGFWLTWYYFGYSPFYGNLIAVLQIVGGLMLMFPRTTLAGACLLFGIIGNIVLIDIFYGVDYGALMVAVLLEVLLAYLLFVHRHELWNLFWASQPRAGVAGWRQWAVNALRVAMVIIPAVFTYFIANFNNRFPTEIDGVWEVTEVSGENDAIPATIFFEYNRAYMVVFKHADSTYTTHHFELAGDDRINMWETWLQKGDPLFDGSYTLNGDTLILEGAFGAQGEEVEITLTKRE